MLYQNKMKTVVIIPTYNERDLIAQLIREILESDHGLNILVIDDNSPDGTGKIVDKLLKDHKNLYIIHRPKKLGLSSAYRDGFAWALQNNFDHIIQMDADFSHRPSHIPELLQGLNAGTDLVIGSRYSNGFKTRDWPLARLFISRSGNFYAGSMLRAGVRDLTSGFRCFKSDFLRKIDLSKISSRGYAFQIEMAYWCLRAGGVVKEIPIIFVGRRKGKSKFSLWQILEAFYLVIRLKCSDRKEDDKR